MNTFYTGLIIIFLSGFFANLFKNKVLALTILTGIGSILTLFPACEVLFNPQTLTSTLYFNEIFGTINFVIDKLSAFFILIITTMSCVSVIYSNGYLKHYIETNKNISFHIIALPMLIASMLGVVCVQNALMFLVFFEIMSLSSFFLVIFENEKKDVRQAGIKYLIFMHISVMFLILTFALLSMKSGSFDFNSFRNILNSNNHFKNLIFMLIFVGFGTKAGFVPFHNWLPVAHPMAPSHVSAIMSGVMIKTGIYGILRIITLIDEPTKTMGYFVLIISMVSFLYGVLYAISEHNFKRMLAYSTIENVGIIGLGMGIGLLGISYNVPTIAVLGFAGAILHCLNHSIFKELLFLASGNIYIKTHDLNMEKLGGLIKTMPNTAILFLVGSIAICGLPPFNGFISEFLIYFGMFKGLMLKDFIAVIAMLCAIAGLALVGTMATLCFTKAFSVMFLGSPREESKIIKDSPKIMTIPMGFLAILTLLIGVYPQYMFCFVKQIAYTIFKPTVIESCWHILSVLQTIALVLCGFLAFLVILCILKYYLTKNKIDLHETWGCGYDRPNNSMQYTASSYASPFLSMLKPLFKKIFDIEKPKKLFPKSAHFKLEIEDIEEAYLINPLIKIDEKFLSKFETLQSGNIQSYIKYGLIFLIIVIIGSLIL